VATASGNGMELDAIAGVYIGGTSATGGVASIGGSLIGAIMLVVIRSGLNFVLALMNININSTYVTYVLTGVIVVLSVLIEIVKSNKMLKKG
jgi:ribose/xylose/arabinose/galactoside ABC-type transport system permease subunit